VVTIEVNNTLSVEVVAGGRDPVVRIGRTDGGLVVVRPDEVRGLVAGLVRAAEILARAAAKAAR